MRIWLYALTDLAEDPGVRPRAEAWVIVSIGITRPLSRCLDGIVTTTSSRSSPRDGRGAHAPDISSAD